MHDDILSPSSLLQIDIPSYLGGAGTCGTTPAKDNSHKSTQKAVLHDDGEF